MIGDETPITNAAHRRNIELGWGSVVVVPDGYGIHDPWELSKDFEVKLAKIRAAAERCQQADREGMPVQMAAHQLMIDLFGILEMPF